MRWVNFNGIIGWSS